MQKKTDHLALFAKYWEPGKVKTRLAAKIGDIAACEIYRIFLNTLLRRFDHTADDRTIVFTPEEGRQEFESIANQRWTLHLQATGGLGQRLTEFTQTAFARNEGPTNLVIIGSDCVDLEHPILEQAFLALNTADVVLGPTHDGGYYLIGLSKNHPDVFADIARSTESVYEQTVARICDNNLSYIELPILRDIDEVEDLNSLLRQLRLEQNHNENTSNLLAAVKAALTEK